MKRLGNAMHTLQDATSPAHEGFQYFDNDWNYLAQWEIHATREFQTLSIAERIKLDAATQRAWDLFKSDEPLPSVILPRPQK